MDKALSQLRALEIDKALVLFYQLLEKHPQDLNLISRIYPIERKKKSKLGFRKISEHIFSISSMSKDFHQLIIQTYIDFKTEFGSIINPNEFSAEQAFNLFHHISQTSYSKDIELFLSHIKTQLSEHSRTPESLYFYCEQLAQKKQFIRARQELKFLMVYYTEATTQQAAEKLFKKIQANF